MAKFNTSSARPAVHSPIVSERTPSGHTFEGAPGYSRDAKGELFLLAVSNMVGEKTFYESANARDDRFEQLVHQVAVWDPNWFGRFVPWLRSEANMRTASLIAAAEGVKARLDAWHAVPVGHAIPTGLWAEHAGVNRRLINQACQRPDEPGELLAYWTSRHGRALPKPVKRGLADAAARLYGERSLLKYDTASKGYRFGDVLELTHAAPDPDKPWQGELFRHALDRRHNRDKPIPERLAMLRRNALLRASTDPTDWLDSDTLRQAGVTWEDALSAVGSKVDKAALWCGLIPSMGYMALLRNLRNFDEAGMPDTVAAAVAAKLSNPEEVAKSRQFPFRFLAAYQAAPSLRWAWPLEQAIGHSLANVPALPGRTLILVDRSGSMFGALSARSELTRADAAAIFGTALALRAVHADLIEFGTSSARVQYSRGESVLRILDRFHNLGGTATQQAVSTHYRAHDRVVIVTDEQAYGSAFGFGGDVTAAVPANTPVYTWNLAGYQYGHAPSGSRNRHTFGGLTDQAFKMIPLLESGRDGVWPF
jgi:hypothetical protein